MKISAALFSGILAAPLNECPGSGDGELEDNCLLSRDSVDITQKMKYENEQFWSKTQFELEFDVFRFPSTGSLRAFCELRMCLDDECPQEASPNC